MRNATLPHVRARRRSAIQRFCLLAGALMAATVQAQERGGWVDPLQRTVNEARQHGQRGFPADMDGDQDLDVLCAWSLTDDITLELNANGDGSAWQTVTIATNFVAMAALPLDVDGDNDLDVAAIALFDRDDGFGAPGAIAWFERPSDIAQSPWTRHDIETGIDLVRFLDVGDIDDDGDDDLAIASVGANSDGNLVAWFENRRTEPTGPRWARWNAATGIQGAQSCRLGDFDDDESLDILVVELNGDRVLWLQNVAPRTNDWPLFEISSVTAGPYASRPADMDGDGDLDALVSFEQASRLAWFENPGNPETPGATWKERLVDAGYGGAREPVFGDFNNDGVGDVATGSAENFPGANLFTIFEGDGAGGWTRRDYPYASYTFGEAGDIDGDGDLDAVTASYGANRIDWWENRHPAGGGAGEPSGFALR